MPSEAEMAAAREQLNVVAPGVNDLATTVYLRWGGTTKRNIHGILKIT
ncbi:hypothetical protein EYZ11_006470 [Aspergillus tanneri]|uniref:Uncharacterized protein n=1 Tax=Aspergillus tanneri TaxID=1220188 RepID=A0A4S3JL85_9EURO|nr:hypothetical protein EYZ11_006470 [Aspergillus tanneri]